VVAGYRHTISFVPSIAALKGWNALLFVDCNFWPNGGDGLHVQSNHDAALTFDGRIVIDDAIVVRKHFSAQSKRRAFHPFKQQSTAQKKLVWR